STTPSQPSTASPRAEKTWPAAASRTTVSASTRARCPASSRGHQSDSSSMRLRSCITGAGRRAARAVDRNCRVGDNYTVRLPLDLAPRGPGAARAAARTLRKYPRQPPCAKLAGAPWTTVARGLDIGGGQMAGSDAAAQLARLGETTFPRLLAKHAAERPNATAMREKDLGIWQAMTWAELKAEVELVAAGLAAAGFERGMKLALVGENRPRLYVGMIATQVLGGVTVPLYQDAVAQEMAYVFRDAGISFAIVEDQEQVDKLLEVRAEYPELRRVWYDDPRGLRNYDEPVLSSYESLLEAGRARLAEDPGLFDREVAAGNPSDPAAIFYTSGTTGNPQGVAHGHNNLISVSVAASQLEHLGPDDEVLAYLPMAWMGQNIFSYTQWLVNGFTVNCPESDQTVAADMREIGPTYYFAPPRVLEALLTQVTIRMEDAAPIKQRMFRYFLDIAKRVGERLLERDASVGVVDRLLYRLGDLLVYGPLRNALGMSRLRVAYTAGEAIGPELFVFFRSIGINLKQLYGSTETAVFVCIQPDGQVRADTVGVPLEGVEVTISESGELLIRSPGLLKEYHNNPDATAEVKDAEGWYHTGDAGYFDTDGQLKIIDRARDVGKLADGSMFA